MHVGQRFFTPIFPRTSAPKQCRVVIGTWDRNASVMLTAARVNVIGKPLRLLRTDDAYKKSIKIMSKFFIVFFTDCVVAFELN